MCYIVQNTAFYQDCQRGGVAKKVHDVDRGMQNHGHAPPLCNHPTKNMISLDILLWSGLAANRDSFARKDRVSLSNASDYNAL